MKSFLMTRELEDGLDLILLSMTNSGEQPSCIARPFGLRFDRGQWPRLLVVLQERDGQASRFADQAFRLTI
jgi:hypothetical protein